MIVTTSSGILYQLRDIYSKWRCCWNVATSNIGKPNNLKMLVRKDIDVKEHEKLSKLH
jgi:hypothetical protein